MYLELQECALVLIMPVGVKYKHVESSYIIIF